MESFCRLHHEARADSISTPEAGHLTANGQLGRWEAALGNIEDARMALGMCVLALHSTRLVPLRRMISHDSITEPPVSLQLQLLYAHAGCRLSHAVDDAVYLDEDAYNQVQPKVAYLKTIQVIQWVGNLKASCRKHHSNCGSSPSDSETRLQRNHSAYLVRCTVLQCRRSRPALRR